MPSDFGIVGMATVIISLFETFTTPGLQEALIQKKEEKRAHLDSAWTALVIRGFGLTLALFLTATLFGKFFKENYVSNILLPLSFVFIFRGLTNIGIIYFQKDLEFYKRFIYVNTGVLIDALSSVILAVILKNFWALVWSVIISDFILMIVSYLMHPFRPKFYFDYKMLRELLNYGKWIWGLGLISFFIFRTDKLIIAKVIGSSALGFYIMANRFADITALNIGRVFSTVMFPAYSRIQDETDRLKKGFITSFEMVLFISSPITIVLVIMAPEITRIILGVKWMPCVVPMQILAIASFIRAIMAPCGSLLKGIGKPKIEFGLSALRAGITFISAIFLTKFWGIVGTSFAVLLGVFLTYPVWVYIIIRSIKINANELFIKIFPIAISTIAMLVCLIFLKNIMPSMNLTYFIFTLMLSLIFFIVPLIFYWRQLNTGPIPQILYYLKGY
jgi:O-antigen/teichoic acid export membrane protein